MSVSLQVTKDACVNVCECTILTLKKGRDDVTVHQGLDVVLGAHS